MRTNSSTPQKEIATPIKRAAKETTLKITTKRITYIATLTALTLCLKMLGNLLTFGGNIKISFTYIGWALSAVILGPFGGAVVGLCTDVLGTFAVPGAGAFNPILTLGYTLYPLITGLFYKYLPLKNKNISLCIGILASTVLCTYGVCSLGLYYTYGYNATMSFWTYIISFRLWQLFSIGLSMAVLLLLTPLIKRLNITPNSKE